MTQNLSLQEILICPDCKSMVTTLGSDFKCLNCNQIFDYDRGVLNIGGKALKALHDHATGLNRHVTDYLMKTRGGIYHNGHEYWLLRDVKEEIAQIQGPYVDQEGRFRFKDLVPKIKHGVVLDIGVGNGYVLDYFLKTHTEGTIGIGIDVALDHLKLGYHTFVESGLSNEKQLRFFHAAVEAIPLKNEIVDVVISTECLEHVINLDSYFKEVFRVLKPGGKVFVTTPNRTGLAFALSAIVPAVILWVKNLLRGRISEFEFTESVGFENIRTAKQIRDPLMKVGFQVLSHEFNHFLPEFTFGFTFSPALLTLLATVSKLTRTIFNRLGIAQFFSFNQVLVAEKPALKQEQLLFSNKPTSINQLIPNA